MHEIERMLGTLHGYDPESTLGYGFFDYRKSWRQEFNFADLADYLSAGGDPTRALHEWVWFGGDSEQLRALLDHGADLEEPDNQRRPPLFCAIKANSGNNMHLLLQAGSRSEVAELFLIVNMQERNPFLGTYQYMFKMDWHTLCADSDEFLFETPRHSGTTAYCSDDECPCGSPGTTIPAGNGYLYVSEEVVERRRGCVCLPDYQLLLELERVAKYQVDTLVDAVVPVLCCENAARRRGLRLEVAAADAKRWWSTGLVPLRPTPRVEGTMR